MADGSVASAMVKSGTVSGSSTGISGRNGRGGSRSTARASVGSGGRDASSRHKGGVSMDLLRKVLGVQFAFHAGVTAGRFAAAVETADHPAQKRPVEGDRAVDDALFASSWGRFSEYEHSLTVTRVPGRVKPAVLLMVLLGVDNLDACGKKVAWKRQAALCWARIAGVTSGIDAYTHTFWFKSESVRNEKLAVMRESLRRAVQEGQLEGTDISVQELRGLRVDPRLDPALNQGLTDACDVVVGFRDDINKIADELLVMVDEAETHLGGAVRAQPGAAAGLFSLLTANATSSVLANVAYCERKLATVGRRLATTTEGDCNDLPGGVAVGGAAVGGGDDSDLVDFGNLPKSTPSAAGRGGRAGGSADAAAAHAGGALSQPTEVSDEWGDVAARGGPAARGCGRGGRGGRHVSAGNRPRVIVVKVPPEFRKPVVGGRGGAVAAASSHQPAAASGRGGAAAAATASLRGGHGAVGAASSSLRQPVSGGRGGAVAAASAPKHVNAATAAAETAAEAREGADGRARPNAVADDVGKKPDAVVVQPYARPARDFVAIEDGVYAVADDMKHLTRKLLEVVSGDGKPAGSIRVNVPNVIARRTTLSDGDHNKRVVATYAWLASQLRMHCGLVVAATSISGRGGN